MEANRHKYDVYQNDALFGKEHLQLFHNRNFAAPQLPTSMMMPPQFPLISPPLQPPLPPPPQPPLSAAGVFPFCSAAVAAASLLESLKMAALQQQQQQQWLKQQQFLQLAAAIQPQPQLSQTEEESATTATETAPTLRPAPSPPRMSTPKKRRTAKRSAASPSPPPPQPPPTIQKSAKDSIKISPVSGTIIRALAKSRKSRRLGAEDFDSADIVTTSNFVEVTPEAQAALAKIPNNIGDFVCQLCWMKFADAFQLAQHRCPCIEYEEYRCPDCSKTFNCSANLASHRRWHKPRPAAAVKKSSLFSIEAILSCESRRAPTAAAAASVAKETTAKQAAGAFSCKSCCRQFKRSAYLRKHLANGGCGSASRMSEQFECDLCGKCCDSQVEFEDHMLSHLMSRAADSN